MNKIVINGGKTLSGTIEISGMKNSVVALIPAAILCDEEAVIENVPDISDKDVLVEILEYLNVNVTKEGNSLKINSKNLVNKEIPCELSSKIRASYYFMGALLGKKKYVSISNPGGCKLGDRKIDIHLDGFAKLGVDISELDNKNILSAKELVGNEINFKFPSVGATINIMLAAVKAKGTTIIQNAAKEPEIINVANFLNNMGAKIKGAGTNKIVIEGVSYLHKARVRVIPDRIEAGTYLVMASLIGDNLKIKNVNKEHIKTLLEKLKESGVSIIEEKDDLIVSKKDNYQSLDIKTLTYPGFPTDLAQPITVFLSQCNGISKIEETIYKERIGHIKELNKMGTNITIKDNIFTIKGKTSLIGKEVSASDLRAGASLVIAGLIANGTTTISNIEYILRGYENIIEKLTNVGADIKIVNE